MVGEEKAKNVVKLVIDVLLTLFLFFSFLCYGKGEDSILAKAKQASSPLLVALLLLQFLLQFALSDLHI